MEFPRTEPSALLRVYPSELINHFSNQLHGLRFPWAAKPPQEEDTLDTMNPYSDQLDEPVKTGLPQEGPKPGKTESHLDEPVKTGTLPQTGPKPKP